MALSFFAIISRNLMGVENAATNGKQKWTKSYSIRASESVRMKNGRGYGWPRPRSRLGGGRVLAITTTPMLSTLPRPPATQRQKPLLIS
jgi:hypothetical protein